MLGLASPKNYSAMQHVWPLQGNDVRMVKIDNSGHFLTIEQPGTVARALIDFFG
jgi:pimeloyl-ACP methyl ester carboxylesterase